MREEMADFDKGIIKVYLELNLNDKSLGNASDIGEAVYIQESEKCEICNASDKVEHEHTDEQVIQGVRDMIVEAIRYYNNIARPKTMNISKLEFGSDGINRISCMINPHVEDHEPYVELIDKKFRFGKPFKLEESFVDDDN